MTILDTLTVLIVGDNTGLDKSAKRSKRTVDKLQGSFNTGGRAVNMLGAGAIKTTGALLGLGTAAATLKLGVKLAADAETAQVAFRTLTGSAETAKKLIGDIREFAAATPLSSRELQDAGRMLVAFGQSAGTVVETLRRLGDVSALTNNRIGDIAEIYGKARVQGRLFAEDINQLTGRGIPIIQEFATQLGVGTEEVKKLASEGKVSFANLEQAFIDMTSEGGKFAGGLAAQADTLAGKWSTFKDEGTSALRAVGGAAAWLSGVILDSNSAVLKLTKSLASIPRRQFTALTEIGSGLGAAEEEAGRLDAALVESNKRLDAQLAIEKRILAFQEKVTAAARKQNELLGLRVNLFEQIAGKTGAGVVDAAGNLLRRGGEDERAETAGFRRFREERRRQTAEAERQRRLERAGPNLAPPGFEPTLADRLLTPAVTQIGGAFETAAAGLMGGAQDIFAREIPAGGLLPDLSEMFPKREIPVGGLLPELSGLDSLGDVDLSGVAGLLGGLGELAGGSLEDMREQLLAGARGPLEIGTNEAVLAGSVEAQRLANRQRLGGDNVAQAQLKEQKKMAASLRKLEDSVGGTVMTFLGLGTGGA